MNRYTRLLLIALSAMVLIIVAALIRSPGYMDADYYYATALRIANGKGLTEPFLWNYLGQFDRLPLPSHGYWMPMATFLGASSMILLGSNSFLAGKVGFVLVAALVPLITAQLTNELAGDRKTSLLAGVMACMPVFFLPYLTVTDTFGIYMLLGGLLFLIVTKGLPGKKPFLMGMIAGAMHLSRAEGFLWMGIVVMALYIKGTRNIRTYLYAAGGYLILFGPWMVRNLVVFGGALGAGSLQGLWLTDYNDLFIYPATDLTFQRWWSRGLEAILKDRLWALKLNAQTFLGVQMQIFMLPLAVWGTIRKRNFLAVKLSLLALAAIMILMTLIFPFQGARGGYFHAVAALQPLLYSLTAIGFTRFIYWAARIRSWDPVQAWRVLAVGMLAIITGMAVFVINTRVIGGNTENLKWNQSFDQHLRIHKRLKMERIQEEDTVMINNPPGYYAVSRQQSIVIPDGELDTLLLAADKYGADYVVLDTNHPQGLKKLYERPKNMPGLNYLQSTQGIHFFRIENTPPQ